MEVEQAAPPGTVDLGSAPSSSSPSRLHDLQPDVLHNVLCFLGNQDLARLCQTSRRLAYDAIQACQHWAPKVEGWLLADPSRADLLQRLRLAGPLTEQSDAVQQPPPRGSALTLDGGLPQQQQHQDAAQPPLPCPAAHVLHERQGTTAECTGPQTEDARASSHVSHGQPASARR